MCGIAFAHCDRQKELGGPTQSYSAAQDHRKGTVKNTTGIFTVKVGNGVQGAKLSKVSNLQGAAVLGYNQVQEDRKCQGEISRLERLETQL